MWQTKLGCEAWTLGHRTRLDGSEAGHLRWNKCFCRTHSQDSPSQESLQFISQEYSVFYFYI
jgi:hypothetical protein